MKKTPSGVELISEIVIRQYILPLDLDLVDSKLKVDSTKGFGGRKLKT